MNPYQANPFDEPSNEYIMPEGLTNTRYFLRGLVAACIMNMFMEYIGYDITFETQGFTAVIALVYLLFTDTFNIFKLFKS